MAISISQYVDLLVKKLYGVSKTDTATNKSPSNEAIPSPSLNRGDTALTQANEIPTIAAATPNLITAYQGTTAIECTADNTTVPVGGIYPTWLTGQQNWIPREFGSTYAVQAYVGPSGAANIVATGTLISDAGAAGSYQWFFDYEAGLLNFIGETIPPSLTSGNVVYITGYQYIGLQGVTNLPNGSNIGNITITDSSISTNNSSLVTIAGTSALIIPTGNSGQRPTSNVANTGSLRLNSDLLQLEVYDGSTWVSSSGGGGNTSPGVITDQQITTADGNTTAFNLNQTATTVGTLVSLNGVVQLPTSAYSISGNVLTFTSAPHTDDVIDVRYISYSNTTAVLTNTSGNSSINVGDTPDIVFTVNSNVAATINAAGTLAIAGQALQLPTYNTAQAIAIATPVIGQVIYVSNGDTGAPSLAVYDGSSWKRVSLGATISAT